MRAIEFNKKENTFHSLQNKTIEICKKNNIDYFEYLSVFYRLLNTYVKAKSENRVIEKLDFSDLISVRAVLNKRHFGSKQKELDLANEKIENERQSLFSFLDKIEDAYFFILNPIFDYGAGLDYDSWHTKGFGYKKRRNTGIDNLDIAEEYALYRINKSL